MFRSTPKGIEFQDLPRKVQAQLQRLGVPGEDIRTCISTLRSVASRFPGFVPGRLNLASYLLARGDVAEAKRTYEGVAKDFPGELGASAGLATVLVAEGDYAQAEQLAQSALDGGYDWAECHAVIAKAREHAGDLASAARSYLSAYEASPHSWQYLERHCRLVDRTFNAPTGPVSQLLTLPQLHDLMAFIDQALRGTECDDTLRHAKRWAEQSALDPVDLYQFLNGHGGFCDCEVCLNVESSLGDSQDVEDA